MIRIFFTILLLSVTNIAFSQLVAPTIGEQKLAVVCLDYFQDGNEQSISDLDDAIFKSDKSLNAFVKAASYGKTWLSGDIYGWYIPDVQLYGTGWTECWPMETDFFNFMDGKIDWSKYDRILMVIHDTTKSCAAGNSTFGKSTYNTPSGPIDVSISRSRQPFYLNGDFSQTTSSTMAHEILHAFGLSFHSNAYVCPGPDPVASFPNSCAPGGYGNLFDIMGLRTQASHPSGPNLETLGWLNSDNMTTTNTPGVYRIYPLEDSIHQRQVLKIPLPNPIQLQMFDKSIKDVHHLYLEYRDNKGFDWRNSFYYNIAQASGGNYEISNLHGALIIAGLCEPGEKCMPYLLDMHPNTIKPSYSPYEASNAYLYLNELFQVPNNDISIKVIDVVPGSYIDVEIIGTPTGISESNSTKITKVGNSILFSSPIQGKYIFQIQDINGKIVQSETGKAIFQESKSHVITSPLSKGIYMVSILGNSSIWTKRILVD